LRLRVKAEYTYIVDNHMCFNNSAKGRHCCFYRTTVVS